MERPNAMDVIGKGFAPTLGAVHDLVAWIRHIEAENARLRGLLKRVLTVCKTDLHIRGVLSQLGEDIRGELEAVP